jgi:hypothetical protein
MSISQNFPQKSPSLNLDFANSKKLDSRVSFTRSASSNGKATFVKDDGSISYANFNNPRFTHSVKEINNLYLWSENTNNWLAGGLSGRNPTATIAPDGSLTGNLITEDLINAQHLIYQDISSDIVQNVNYTFSIYAKQYSTNRTLSLTVHGGSYSNFDLGSGRILATGGFACKMEPVGNGWYRCSITTTFPTTVGRFYAIIYNSAIVYTGDGTSGIYVWGAQVEVGSTPSTYTRTTTSRSPTYPTISKGILVEEDRTNLIVDSNSSDLGNWFVENTAYVKRNVAVAPDNTLSADKLVSKITGGTNNCFVQKYESVAANNKTYVFSVFLKQGTSPQTTINMQLSGGTYQQSAVTIDWRSRSIVYDTGSNGTITPYGNGWYRVSTALTNNGTNTTIYPRIYVRDQGSSNVKGHFVYIWGWQVETVSYGNDVQSTFPTTYIPSTETFTSRNSTATVIGGDNNIMYDVGVNVPRYDFWPSNQNGQSFLLLEPASTNLLTYTESFGNWTLGNGATISSNVAGINDPKLTQTADKLVESAAVNGNVQHIVYYARSGTNETLTFSMFVRRAERNRVSIQFSNFLNETAQAFYDLILGTATLDTGLNGTDYVDTSAEIIPYHDGWFRCILTTTKNAVNTNNNVSICTLNASGQVVYTGDGTSGVYLWGAQLESGTSATSYIPATGASNITRATDMWSTAATTRFQDLVKLENLTTSTWFNNKTSFGSFYMEFDDIGKIGTNGSFTRIFEFYDTVLDSIFRMAVIPNSYAAYPEVYTGGSYITTYQQFTLSTTKNKIFVIYDTVQLIVVANGLLITRQILSTDILDKLNTLIFADKFGGSLMNGTISKFQYYPYCIELPEAIQMTK